MPKGKSELKLLNDDVVLSDNIAYLNNQEDKKAKVVIISNGESKYLEAALSASSGIDLDIKTPGNVRSNYDLYILDHAGNIPSVLSKMLNDELEWKECCVDCRERSYWGLRSV